MVFKGRVGTYENSGKKFFLPPDPSSELDLWTGNLKTLNLHLTFELFRCKVKPLTRASTFDPNLFSSSSIPSHYFPPPYQEVLSIFSTYVRVTKNKLIKTQKESQKRTVPHDNSRAN